MHVAHATLTRSLILVHVDSYLRELMHAVQQGSGHAYIGHARCAPAIRYGMLWC